MIFSISNDGNEWFPDFGPDPVILTVKDLGHEMTINSQEITLAAWCWLLSRRQDFSNNHLARIPVTSNQQGKYEMRHKEIPNESAQDMDACRHQLTDLDNFEFDWEKNQPDVDVVLRLGIDTSFSPTAFDDLEVGGSAEKPILLHQGKYKENSPTTTAVSERTTRPRRLLTSRPFGTRIENIPDYVDRNLF